MQSTGLDSVSETTRSTRLASVSDDVPMYSGSDAVSGGPSTPVGRAIQTLYLCPPHGDRHRNGNHDCSHECLPNCHYTLPLPLSLTLL